MSRASFKAYKARLSRFIYRQGLRLFHRSRLRLGFKTSFSQSGEDIIASYIFESIGNKKPTYLDIGAYHPYSLSNTASFYLNGCRGINIEPNPQLLSAFVHERPEDINLNIGIAEASGEQDYYVMSDSVLNTFSEESVRNFVKEGYSLVAKHIIPVSTITDVVDNYCAGRFPDFLSLDIEGLELPILSTINFEKSSPIVICAETLSFSKNHPGVKNYDIIRFLEGKGYIVYADTHLNSLFVRSDVYQRR